MFFTKEDHRDEIEGNVDRFLDSYARDTMVEELKEVSLFSRPPSISLFLTNNKQLDKLLDKMKVPGKMDQSQISQITERLFVRAQQEGHDGGQGISPGWLFQGLTIYFHHDPSSSAAGNSHRLRLASNLARFGGASIASAYNTPNRNKNKDKGVTHIIIDPSSSTEQLSTLRKTLSSHAASGMRIPHLVTVEWIEESWKARTLLDEESMSSLTPLPKKKR